MIIEGTRRTQEPGISPSSPSSPSSSPTPKTVWEVHVHSSKIPPNPP
ncbi:hypothetical protein [Scytonema sp. PCC 10023]